MPNALWPMCHTGAPPAHTAHYSAAEGRESPTDSGLNLLEITLSFRSALLLSAASLALLSGAAQAADLLVSAAPEQAAASSNWDGFYAGMFAGYAAGTLTTTDNWNTSPYEEDYSGYLVGLQAGYNFTLSDNIVGGFAVDVAYNNGATEDPSYVTTIGWSGSATARLGLDLNGVVPISWAASRLPTPRSRIAPTLPTARATSATPSAPASKSRWLTMSRPMSNTATPASAPRSTTWTTSRPAISRTARSVQV